MSDTPLASRDSFEELVADLAGALESAIPPWRARLATAAAEWRALGFEVAVLERAIALPTPPDLEVLLATFERAARQLAAYEAEAVALDAGLAGAAAFRDPARVREAATVVARARLARAAARDDGYPDGEHWVLAWPDVGDLLAGELA